MKARPKVRTVLFTMRVPPEWVERLKKVAKAKSRTRTAHLERCFEVSCLIDKVSEGLDEMEFVKRCAKKTKRKKK
jgi:predicted transcriptional regulator